MATSEWPGFFDDGCYFIEHAHDIRAVKERDIDRAWDMRESDVLVVTFPKSGTLWMLNVISTMYEDMNMYLSPTDKAVRLCYVYEKTDEFVPGLYGEHVRCVKKNIPKMASPRLLACHIHPQHFHSSWREGNRKCKIIYITRNPKDVCVSFYHFMRSVKFSRMELTWEGWVQQFAKGKVWFGPWLEHVSSWQRYGRQDNVLHLHYEDMKLDLKSQILRVAEFLERPLSEERLDMVVQRSSVASMRSRGVDSRLKAIMDEGSWDSSGAYIRKGQSGNWKNHFTVTQSEWFDEYLKMEIEKKSLTVNYHK
ncbi:amine sulfotransferase-like [Ptychodera flava]|uniref:amine sulfotransferase-like n=1 Tax=Ptychodera flava TaxID=63121 RepID=UPI00396A49DC